MTINQRQGLAVSSLSVFCISQNHFILLRRLLSILVCSVVAVLCTCSTPEVFAQSSKSPSAEITAIIQRFVEAQRSYDPAAIKQVTADNYVEVSPLGEVDARKAVLGFYDPSQRVDVPSASVTDPDIRVIRDTAVAIVAIKYVVAAPGQPSHEVAMRATFVVMKLKSKWKLVSAQYTTIHSHESQH